jgi:hypothetical protein
MPALLFQTASVLANHNRSSSLKTFMHKRDCLAVLLFPALFLFAVPAVSETSNSVVFAEGGFSAADSATPSVDQLAAAFPAARLATAEQLPSALKDPTTRLLVLAYGSAFPESAWPEILTFLQNGGDLLVIGGRPFSRAAYRDAGGWKLRDYSVRFAHDLMIDQYQPTPGSDGLQFVTNPEIPLRLTPFSWNRAFSPVIRLSSVGLYHRDGSAGSIDARVDAFAWGMKDGRKLAAPAIQIDHVRNGFSGGRWIFVNAELQQGFFSATSSRLLVQGLAERALRGSEEFAVRPEFPLYLSGEPVQLLVTWEAGRVSQTPLSIKVAEYPQDLPQARTELPQAALSPQPLLLPAPTAKGLHVIEAQLLEGDKVLATYHSAFWVRDEAYLRSGPRMTVNGDYFEMDGKPLAVIGTTHMSSEVQREYFDHPNVYVWDQDLSQIEASGLNMIRTGWWTGWDKLCDENGRPYERTMRTLEAYLMTARRHHLPVQFNFLAFLPYVLGGANPYLDPEAVRRQQTLVTSIVSRFREVPWLAWDLINEPSISQHVWVTRPNGDPIELTKWNQWLGKRYPDRAALAAAWNLSLDQLPPVAPLPEEAEFTPRGMYAGHNSRKVYDYFLFAQEVFADWVRAKRDAIRSTGSEQLITVGQDEGGTENRLSPAFWGQFVDFTTNHSWWLNDDILWDSLLAKQPGETLLIQETGVQRELNLDETARRTPENEASLLERKIAGAFIQSSGAIEWLWNTNSYMTESNETPIGAVLPDETEKPEATVLRDYASFSKSLSPHLRNPRPAPIAIITSQAAQYSVLAEEQLEAQQKAVRALVYNDHLTAYAIAENQIDKLGTPRLAILPSPQSLGEKAWRALLRYVNDGGNLLITGPVEYDEHWQKAGRVLQLQLDAVTDPLTYHNAELRFGERSITLSFDQQKQNWLDAFEFKDGATFKDIPHGKGRIFWAAYPVELAEGTEAAADLYRYVAVELGIAPLFELRSPLSPGILIYPTVLEDSVLYVVVSEAAEDTKIDLRDKLTGALLSLSLPSQHAALAVIGKQEKTVVTRYGF